MILFFEESMSFAFDQFKGRIKFLIYRVTPVIKIIFGTPIGYESFKGSRLFFVPDGLEYWSYLFNDQITSGKVGIMDQILNHFKQFFL